jgi:E3 ubiquitin-protein ligase HUWE1
MPTTPEMADSIRGRLLALARGWDSLPTDLVTYASTVGKVQVTNEDDISLGFYPEPKAPAPEPAAAAAVATNTSPVRPSVPETPTRPSVATQRAAPTPAPKVNTPLPAKLAPVAVESSRVVVDFGTEFLTNQNACLDRIATLTEEYRMPTDTQLLTMNKVRLVMNAEDREVRRQLLTSRLLALACYGKAPHPYFPVY